MWTDRIIPLLARADELERNVAPLQEARALAGRGDTAGAAAVLAKQNERTALPSALWVCLETVAAEHVPQPLVDLIAQQIARLPDVRWSDLISPEFIQLCLESLETRVEPSVLGRMTRPDVASRAVFARLVERSAAAGEFERAGAWLELLGQDEKSKRAVACARLGLAIRNVQPTHSDMLLSRAVDSATASPIIQDGGEETEALADCLGVFAGGGLPADHPAIMAAIARLMSFGGTGAPKDVRSYGLTIAVQAMARHAAATNDGAWLRAALPLRRRIWSDDLAVQAYVALLDAAACLSDDALAITLIDELATKKGDVPLPSLVKLRALDKPEVINRLTAATAPGSHAAQSLADLVQAIGGRNQHAEALLRSRGPSYGVDRDAAIEILKELRGEVEMISVLSERSDIVRAIGMVRDPHAAARLVEAFVTLPARDQMYVVGGLTEAILRTDAADEVLARLEYWAAGEAASRGRNEALTAIAAAWVRRGNRAAALRCMEAAICPPLREKVGDLFRVSLVEARALALAGRAGEGLAFLRRELAGWSSIPDAAYAAMKEIAAEYKKQNPDALEKDAAHQELIAPRPRSPWEGTSDPIVEWRGNVAAALVELEKIEPRYGRPRSRARLCAEVAAQGDVASALKIAMKASGGERADALCAIGMTPGLDRAILEDVADRLASVGGKGRSEHEQVMRLAGQASFLLTLDRIDDAIAILRRMAFGASSAREDLAGTIAAWFGSQPDAVTQERAEAVIDAVEGFLQQEKPGALVALLPELYFALSTTYRERVRDQAVSGRWNHETERFVVLVALWCSAWLAGERELAGTQLDKLLAPGKWQPGEFRPSRAIRNLLRIEDPRRTAWIHQVLRLNSSLYVEAMESAAELLVAHGEFEPFERFLGDADIAQPVRRLGALSWAAAVVTGVTSPVTAIDRCLSLVSNDAGLLRALLPWLRVALLRERRFEEADEFLADPGAGVRYRWM